MDLHSLAKSAQELLETLPGVMAATTALAKNAKELLETLPGVFCATTTLAKDAAALLGLAEHAGGDGVTGDPYGGDGLADDGESEPDLKRPKTEQTADVLMEPKTEQEAAVPTAAQTDPTAAQIGWPAAEKPAEQTAVKAAVKTANARTAVKSMAAKSIAAKPKPRPIGARIKNPTPPKGPPPEYLLADRHKDQESSGSAVYPLVTTPAPPGMSLEDLLKHGKGI